MLVVREHELVVSALDAATTSATAAALVVAAAATTAAALEVVVNVVEMVVSERIDPVTAA